MADKKLTDLAPIGQAADSDTVYIVTDPLGSPQSKQMILSDFLRLSKGFLIVTGGVGSQALAPATWTKITQFTADVSLVNATADSTDDSVLIPQLGQYRGTMQCSFTSDQADEFRLGIYWNGVIQGISTIQQIPDTTTQTMTLEIPFSVTVEDLKCEAYVYSTAGSVFSIKEALLEVKRDL